MTVAIPVIDYLDLATKHIYLLSGVREYHPVEDIYTEIRNIRRLDETMRVFDMPVKAYGAVPKGGGKFTARYAQINDGWRVVPEDITHDLLITGEQITDDGQSGKACMDLTTISPGVNIFVHYEPPSSELVKDAAALAAIAFMSFDNRISVDILHGFSIAAFTGDPNILGNLQYPVNSFEDGLIIANNYGIKTIEIAHSTTLELGAFSEFNFCAVNHVNTTLTVNSPADVENIKLTDVRIEGVLDGGIEAYGCIIGNISDFNGHIHDSSLGGTIVLGGAKEAYLINCARLESEIVPTIDFNNDNNHLVMPNYTGVIKLTNISVSTVNVMIGLNVGNVILDSTSVTAGTIMIIGNGYLVDENGDVIPSGTWNGATIINKTMSNESIAQSVLNTVSA